MDNDTLELLHDVMMKIIFMDEYHKTDCLVLLNWAMDHKSAKVYQHNNGFLSLKYCGRCGTIIAEGDRFCHQCGRELRG